ncbi:MAG TPA: type II toxin-antitoxin system mRNA interferase toxin, RelE/StbE family [Clostridiales bacterium]|nr:type II toxin-antitoxin system mRNA interferase toxin, RelE/StbE family [Clostridiales bacterium]
MANIKFSPEAQNDLTEVRDYIAEELGNSKAADSTIPGILQSVRILEHFPESGSPLSRIISVDTGFRYVIYKNYLSFYRHINGTIYIDRILYGKRDYMRILFRDSDNLSAED